MYKTSIQFLVPGNSVFMLGIGGSGMRGLAYLLHQQGVHIVGSDDKKPTLGFQWEHVNASGIKEALIKCQGLIYSDAVERRHSVRTLIRELQIEERGYHEVLGSLAKKYTTIAIAGTHGKSSTTAFLSHILIEAGLDPTVLIGATVPTWQGQNARHGLSNIFIVEADEYRRHFLELQPTHAGITSIDHDHPDYFRTPKDNEKAFGDFLERIPPHGSVTTLASIKNKYPGLPWPQSINLVHKTFIDALPTIPIPGDHMRRNIGIAASMCIKLFDIRMETIKTAIKTFPGLMRRMETIGSFNGIEIISDYAHHPTEVAETLSALRSHRPGKKVLAIFEPHTYERLIQFQREFEVALSKADGVLVVPIFVPPGRDGKKDLNPVLQSFVQNLGKSVATWQQDWSAIETFLTTNAGTFDVAIALSAGTLDSILRKLVLRTLE